MPGVQRVTLDRLYPIAEECVALGIPVLALFPVLEPSLKSDDGREALNAKGLVPRVVRELKPAFPELGVLTDVALDPYTSHGQDGLVDAAGYVVNDATVERARRAGAGPGRSRRRHRRPVGHDGRPHRRDPRGARGRGPRQRPDHELRRQVRLGVLRPVPRRGRLARPAGKGDKKGYQMDPANAEEALREVALDLAEGADIVIVKPGLPYLDIVRRVKDAFGVPMFAYQVSGEYAMLKAAAQNGWLDHDATMMEVLGAFKRAGADGVLTYFALEAARLLKRS